MTGFDVPTRARWLYLLLIAIQVVGGISIWGWYDWPWQEPPLRAFVSLWTILGSLTTTAVILSLLFLEGGGWSVVIATRFFEQRKRERELYRQRIRNEVNAAWIAWNARREEAARMKKPFNEPPPSEVADSADEGGG